MGITTAAVIGSALVGAGASYYQAEEQKKAAEEQQRRLEAEETRQRLEAERIARETRPEGETIGSAIKFGTMGDTTATSDFLVPRQTLDTSSSGLKTTGSSGLGFVL